MRDLCEKNDEQQIKNVDYEIDEEIYKLYGITDKEKEVIEMFLNNGKQN